MKYLDMPIQHTVDRVLSGMNRRLTKKKLFDLVGKPVRDPGSGVSHLDHRDSR